MVIVILETSDIPESRMPTGYWMTKASREGRIFK
jgi:hypothetical protein